MYLLKDFKITNDKGEELDLDGDIKLQLETNMYHFIGEDGFFVTSMYWDDTETGLMMSHSNYKADSAALQILSIVESYFE